MIKTQIQLPDEMYRSLKRLADRQEWSLAETLRRGSELLLNRYSAHEAIPHWEPPRPRKLGWKGLTHQQVKEQVMKDLEKSELK
jgi:hypothetical protein